MIRRIVFRNDVRPPLGLPKVSNEFNRGVCRDLVFEEMKAGDLAIYRHDGLKVLVPSTSIDAHYCDGEPEPLRPAIPATKAWRVREVFFVDGVTVAPAGKYAALEYWSAAKYSDIACEVRGEGPQLEVHLALPNGVSCTLPAPSIAWVVFEPADPPAEPLRDVTEEHRPVAPPAKKPASTVGARAK